MRHLSDPEFEAFWTARLDGKAARRVTRHLLSKCESCRARLWEAIPREVFWSRSTAESEEIYETCIERAREVVRPLEERWKADGASREAAWLKAHRENLTQARRDCASTWAYVELLLQLSFEARYRDPTLMLSLALTAMETTEQMESAPYGESALFDLRARVGAEVANARRINEFFDLSALSLEEARSDLEKGSGSLMIQARIDDIEASLRRAERNLEEAEILLDRIYRTYLRLGERHLAGRALVKKAMCQDYAGQPLEGIRLYKRAIRLLDASRDPQLWAAAKHNLLHAMAEAGQFAEAEQLLLKSNLRQIFADEPLNLARLRWVEGKIMVGRGRLADAERVLTEVREGFCARRLELVSAIVGMDLAQVILRQGDRPRAHALASELRERSYDRNLPTQAKFAIVSFEQAARHQVATPKMAEHVGRFLDRLRSNPKLEWTPELMLVG